MKNRVYNFNPGPSTLPLEVLQIVQSELLDYRGTGMSILEISHRSEEFEEINDMAIHLAKDLELKVMLGCMVESSIGITAMSQFASKADYLDLDGNLLIKNDPYRGVQIQKGIPVLPSGNGLGLSLNLKGEKAGLK